MKKIIKENKDTIVIGIISIIAFVLGCLSVGILISMLIIGALDIALFFPVIYRKYIPKKKGKKKKHPKSKDKKKNEEKKTDSKKKRKKKKSKKWKTILKVLLVGFFAMCVLTVFAVLLFIWYIVNTAPTFNPDNLYKQESSVFYDIDGNVYATLGAEKRENVDYEDLPEVLINAIVATEDSRFFEHNGVDWARFLKATFQQLLGKSDAGGASTITMQVSKNDVTQDKTSSGIKGIIRKFQDVYVSMNQLEKNYSKEQIMEFYVNSYYLGGGASGVEQACQTYFGKSVREINLAEASIIAGLFQLPNTYNPLVYPEKTETRRKTVLNLMVRHGYITKEERDAALAIPVEELVKNGKQTGEDNKYIAFIDVVVKQLAEEYGEGYDPYTTSMEVYTTMDASKQDHINAIMSGETWKWENDTVTAGIAAIDTKTGAIVAVGGGRDVVAKGFNTAIDTKNQIGSTAKPLYDYGPGIEYENWSTYTPFPDEVYSYSDGTNMNNWDVRYEGFLTARNALAHSRNVSALKAFQANKNANIRTFVTNLGLHPEDEGGTIHEAHAIGGYNGESPISMAAAYAAFANEGNYIAPYSFTKVVMRKTGEEIEKKIEKNKVMGEDTAYMVYDMLITTGKYALGGQYNVNGTTYGAKTGTSNFDDKTKELKGLPDNAINDYWVTGVSSDYAISVWYGYNKVYQRKNKNAANYCKNCYNSINEIYHRKMFQKVAKGFFKNSSQPKMPNNVVRIEVENETYPAQLPSAYTPAGMRVKELFKKGTEPTQTSTRFAQLENVTNVNSSINGNEVTITWDTIATPAAIDEGALKSFFSTFWKNPNAPLKSRLSYNNKHIGNVAYRVYAVLGDGSLEQVDYTAGNTARFNVTPNSSTKYIIKTSYSIFTGNMSSGVEVNLDLSNVTNDISAELVGDSTYVVSGTYSENGVKVSENGNDVTNNSSVSVKYLNSANQEIKITDIKESGKYYATYAIKYGTFTKTLTRKIVVP